MAGQPVRYRQGCDPPSVPLSVSDRVRSNALLSEAAGTGAWLEGSRFSYDTEEADMQSWVNSLADAIAQTVKEN